MQPQNVVIEQATREDVAAILGLYEAAGIRGSARYSIEEAQQQLDHFARYPYYRVFVAKICERAVGTYELIVFENLAKAGAKTAVVEDVAVDPALQNRGIGKALMEHARQMAKEQGAYKLALSSNEKRLGAHAFYEALGFQRHGISFVVDP